MDPAYQLVSVQETEALGFKEGKLGGLNPHDKYILNKGATRKYLKGDLMHYSYYSVDEHLLQMNSFSTIMARSSYEQGKRVSYVGLIFRPLWRFLKEYIFLRGFMDGFYGYIVCVNSAQTVFLKCVKLRNLYREEKKSQK